MHEPESCFVQHFRHYAELTDRDRELLQTLERDPVRIPKDTALWMEGDRANNLGIVSRGWAITCRHLEDGTRQIIEIFLPGDVIGLSEFAFDTRLNSVVMLEEGDICYLPHQRLIKTFQASSTLSTILFAISSHGQALLTERLTNMSRRSARQKLAHFLYETQLRLQRSGTHSAQRFRLPFSQQQIGEVLGMSPVHVSRTFAVFRNEGLAFRQRQWIEVPDPQALAQEADFDAKYLQDDLSHL